jgi:hypothetical protein
MALPMKGVEVITDLSVGGRLHDILAALYMPKSSAKLCMPWMPPKVPTSNPKLKAQKAI